jgi:PAS domain S-box-containing protein
MKIQENDKSEATELRQKAEAELTKRKLPEKTFEVDNLKLIHELQVHQIQLEMQNEELTIAREQAEAAMEKYTDLYDFAPSGYLALSPEGDITDLNFATSALLGNDRSHLKNTRLGLYIAPESLDLYNDFFEKIFQFREKRSCELSLRSKTDKSIYVHIDALVSQSLNICLITMIDITKRKEMEVELQKAMYQLKELNSYFLSRELRMIDLKKEINELLVKSGCEKEFLM